MLQCITKSKSHSATRIHTTNLMNQQQNTSFDLERITEYQQLVKKEHDQENSIKTIRGNNYKERTKASNANPTHI